MTIGEHVSELIFDTWPWWIPAMFIAIVLTWSVAR